MPTPDFATNFDSREEQLVATARELAAKHFRSIVETRIREEVDGDTGASYTEVMVRVDSSAQTAFNAYRAFLREWTPKLSVEECRLVRLTYTFK